MHKQQKSTWLTKEAARDQRQWHVVDNTPSSSCYGNIYVTWHNSNQQIVATSENDCSSWTGRTNPSKRSG